MPGNSWPLLLAAACALVCGGERDFTAAFIAAEGKGYKGRPCGLDMNRNGAVGEAADRLVSDGKTRDPDGDGVDEDIFYVDSERGSDETGSGSPARPFKTVQKALDAADGPRDGAEEIICISGTFHETLTIRNYGYHEANGGAIKLSRWGTGSQSHVYIHDVEFHAINKAEKDASGKIVISFWGGPMTDVAVINNLVHEYSSYFCRGAPPDGAGRFRFQNNTLRMHGLRGGSFVTGWKLWGHHTGVEILDNVLDCNAEAWQPLGQVSGIGVCQGTQDWTIRGNVLIDLPITLQPFAAGYPFQRTLNHIAIDRNVFRSTYRGWR